MNKKYHNEEMGNSMVGEPEAAYTVNSHHPITNNGDITRNRIMTNTVSVDEYFDELITKVHEDYANL